LVAFKHTITQNYSSQEKSLFKLAGGEIVLVYGQVTELVIKKQKKDGISSF
jgi:hypothetical protein